MKPFQLFIFLFFVGHLAKAQDVPSPPLSLNDPQVLVLPFKRAGNLILLEARADTFTGNFILDTGAPGIILNRTWFRAYPRMAEAEAMGITGNTSSVFRTELRDFQLGRITETEVIAEVIDLGHIERSRGVPVLGLIGVGFFKGYEIIIDYPQNVLYILELDRKGIRKSQHAPQFKGEPSKINMQLINNTILIGGEIGGKRLRFSVDTGAETNVLHNRLPETVLQEVQITRRAVLSGTGSKKVEVLGGQIQRLRIGGSDYKDVRTIVTNLSSMSRAYDLNIDGMLGHDFLSLGVVSINFVRKEFMFWSQSEGVQP